MNITFTINYNAYFDIDMAYIKFYDILDNNPDMFPESAIYEAIDDNISWPAHLEEYPTEAIEQAAKALRKRIGGYQMRMELD